MPIEAKVIADSISPESNRLTTFRLRYPRFVHSEFMTHRMLSRNASSSRAIPVAKLIEEVRKDSLRASPVYWGAEQKGMQSGAELDPAAKFAAQQLWKLAALGAANSAEALVAEGVHKSIVNRLLEPFSHINVVASATEWDNFFGLRLDRAAEPTMRALAETMWEAYNESRPEPLSPGQWHLPFVDWEPDNADSESDAAQIANHYHNSADGLDETDLAIRMSVARCARVSYQSFETQRRSTLAEDLILYSRLVGSQPIHASPAEHQATPDNMINGTRGDIFEHRHEHGNFTGWRQFRKTLRGESCAPLPNQYLPF